MIERHQRTPLAWLLLGLLAFVALPWFARQDGVGWLEAFQGLRTAPDNASGLFQALDHGRLWLWSGLLGLLLCVPAFVFREEVRRARWLVAGGTVGVLGLLLGGFLVGLNGWNYEVLAASFGPLSPGQPGFGWGAVCVLLSLLMLFASGVARQGYFRSDVFVAGAVVICGALLTLFIAFPVLRTLADAFRTTAGDWGFASIIERLSNERLSGLGCVLGDRRCGTAWNTLYLGLLVAFSTTVLGTILALLGERGPKRLAGPLRLLSLLPMITPPFVVGLGLILLFGRAGLVNQFLEWAFAIEPSRWFYGFFGIWLAQVFAFTPIAYMIMRGVVQGISPSLEEASQTLHASRWQTFRTVTLPLLKPGLANAFLVGFVESMADFGNPIIVGGQFSVLSTDIFFAIVGAQFDQGRAASLALVLTLFAIAVFAAQRWLLAGAQYTTVAGKGDAGVAMPLPRRVKAVLYGVSLPWLGFTAIVYLFAFIGGFVKTWGRDYTITLAHFKTAFDVQWADAAAGGGLVWVGSAWNSLYNTVLFSAVSAPLTAALGLLIAWLVARTQFRGRHSFEFLATLSFAIPGTVLGVAYVMAFNVPPFELTGTALIIILCFVFRNLPVGVRAGAAAFEQIDRSLDEASWMLRASTATTLRRVTLPLLKPAVIAALIYSFVRAMTTVSAVIFLVTAETELATTYIIGRVGTGDYGVALAYCTALIVLMSLATVAIQWLVGERRLGRRASSSVGTTFTP